MQSMYPMFIIDDDGRCVDVNTAACLLLRISREESLKLRLSDLTPADARGQLAELRDTLRRDGYSMGSFTLLAPDGMRMETDFSALANIEPHRHLAVFVLSAHRSAPAVAPLAAGAASPPPTLTARERQVLSYVALGETTATIAERLFIAPTTVETHVANALRKLAAKTRAHAIAIALRTSLIDG